MACHIHQPRYVLRYASGALLISEQVDSPASLPINWARFRDHVKHVRHLRITLSETPGSVKPVIEALGSVSAHPLFPSLRSLNIITTTFPGVSRVIDTLASPCLRHLQLKFDGTKTRLDSTRVVDTITGIRMLRLATLSIRLATKHSLGSHIPRAVEDAIRSQPLLRSLTVLGLTSKSVDLLVAASTLQDLEEVVLADWMDKGVQAQVDLAHMASLRVPGSLASLRSISMFLTKSSLPLLVAAVPATSLTALRLRLPQAEQDIPSALHGCLTHLRNFTLLSAVALAFPGVSSTWKDFVPLLACPRMSSVKLEGPGLAIAIGDGEIETMGKSWPLLEVLKIEDTARKHLSKTMAQETGEPPRTTLAGLACLAFYCPSLRKLRISIDARAGDNDLTASVTGDKMEEVAFPLSRVKQEDTQDTARERAIARFIATMWPNQKLPAPVSQGGGPWEAIYLRQARWIQGGCDRLTWERIWMMAYIYLECGLKQPSTLTPPHRSKGRR